MIEMMKLFACFVYIMFYLCLPLMINIVNPLSILLPDFLETVVKEDADCSHQIFFKANYVIFLNVT